MSEKKGVPYSAMDLKPVYEQQHPWENYSSSLLTEYRQSVEEGLDIAAYKDIFAAVAQLPKDETREKLADALFNVVANAGQAEDYAYEEPSALAEIRALRPAAPQLPSVEREALEDRIHGAWLGRICGCLAGKTVEGIRTNELHPFLQESGNWPMHRYIRRSDVTEETLQKYNYPFGCCVYADVVRGMPVDDDTNYVVLAQEVIERYGRNFTPQDMAQAWLTLQSKNAYCTAERVAFCNFVKGYQPPVSAMYKNPYREWIGAQIRGDYFGYINPGDPELAADMAFRDACISHVKNGIYGEMFAAAMLAAAACTKDIRTILLAGLGQIPATSRLYAAVTDVLHGWENGVSQQDCFADIHARYDEYTEYGWCHTIPNAMIVTAALLYGEGDYGRSVCMAVETGFDTDCNGATVGSVLGMAYGTAAIGEAWTAPIRDTLHTSILDVNTVRISDRVKKTLEHLPQGGMQ